jgi:putative transposase
MDAYSRRIIGWSIAHHMRTELVIDALGMATLRRQPDNGSAILHSDYAEPCVKPRDRVLAWAGGVA